MDHEAALLAEIETFLAAHEMAPTTFGQLALRDKHFVRQLREGRGVVGKTARRVRSFMLSYRPNLAKDAA